jgi:DNA primase
MIDQSTIDKIYEASQIVDVVQDYVSLKRRGVNYIGCCPFHNEKTPSFTVSAAKGIYKCFGCGKGGNSVNFVMEQENISYYEALKFLAKKFHIEIVEKEVSAQELAQKNERESMLLISEFAGKHFHEILHKNQEGKAVGLAYFKERGIREDMISKFHLGYALEKRDAFTDAAIAAGFKKEYMVKTGLTIEKENRYFDRFSGRVLFPIHSISGQVIGFGGRILKTDKNTAKYLNSPESEIYHKSRVLYGMFQAKKAILQNDKCFLVEGYTDVISMHQAGIENVVASSGTSLTTEQIALIKRFTSSLTILYDGDAAGIKAAIRGIDMVLEQGINVKIVLLPDGDDPDSYSRKHSATEVLDYIKKNESDFVLFKARLLLEDAKNDPVKRATLISDIVRSIAIVPDAITRSVYVKECASILNSDENLLYAEITRIKRAKYEAENNVKLPENRTYDNHVPQQTIQVQAKSTVGEIQERELIRLLLMYGNNILFSGFHDDSPDMWIVTVGQYVITEIENDELEITNPVYKQIFDEFSSLIHHAKDFDEKYFIHHRDAEISSVAADLLTKKYTLSKNLFSKGSNYQLETEEMKLPDMVPATVIDFKNKKIMVLLREAQLQLLEAQQNSNFEKIEECQQRIHSFNEIKKTFAVSLGNRTILH